MKYIVTYTSWDAWSGECENETVFDGDYDALQAYLERLKDLDCYRFSVSAIDEDGERW